ncbi:type II toxin-antitoxin system RelB/DinJ family antitoxin [Bartonella sp. B17]
MINKITMIMDANQVIQAPGLSMSDIVRVLMTCIAKGKAILLALFQPSKETRAVFAEIDKNR